MSREDVIHKIRVMIKRLEQAEQALHGKYDPILAVGVDALREELSRLGRLIHLAR